MLLDRRNKYCQNVNTTQSDLHIQRNPYQNHTSVLHRARTNNLQVCMEPVKTPNAQSHLEEEHHGRRHHIPDFGLHHKAVITTGVWYWHENRPSDQWNRIENADTDPPTHGDLIFEKAGIDIQGNRDSLSSQWCWDHWTATRRKMNPDPFLTPPTTINSKRMKDRKPSKSSRGKQQGPHRLRPQQRLTRHVSGGKGDKSKNDRLGPHRAKELLHSQGNNPPVGKATDGMGEVICKRPIR